MKRKKLPVQPAAPTQHVPASEFPLGMLGDVSVDGQPDGTGPGDADIGVPPSREPRSRVDHAFDFVTFVSRQLPIAALLDGVPGKIARIVGADIVSIYLLEGHGDGLVLRGNVGFSPEARGQVRLRVGEGLTGLAVQQKRPVFVVRAPRHERFRRFAELPEDRFPIFLALPILGPDQRSLGALVMQRGEGAFSEQEIVLATALTAPIAYAIRHAALLDDLRNRPLRKTGGGTRRVTLPGRPVYPGRAIGAVAAIRRPAKDRNLEAGADEAKRLKHAFQTVEKAVLDWKRKADAIGEGHHLDSYVLVASDGRLRERALELVGKGKGGADALSTVAREVTRAATGLVGDPYLAERARDIENLCDTVLMLASPDARAETPSKAVLLGDEFTVYDLIVTARAEPVAIALTERSGEKSLGLLKLLGVPAIVDVEGAFRWAAPGDVALVDADHGFLTVNPSRAEVSELRAFRRDLTDPDQPAH